MRWAFLAAAVCAFVILLGAGQPKAGLYAAFVVMGVNFATLCLQYDDPIKRARARVAAQLRGLNKNTDVAQRLETAKITPNAADRRRPFGLVSFLNFTTGLAGILLLGWGVTVRFF
jgi:hypothetical protein